MNVHWIHKDEVFDGKLSSLLSIGIRKLHDHELNERRPLSLVLVVDVSGSMNEPAFTNSEFQSNKTRIEATKDAIYLLFPRLTERDRLGVVLFDSKVEKLFPLTLCTKNNIEEMKKRIGEVKSRNCTNISGGLLMGLEMLDEREEKETTVGSVFLFTDGEANRGLSDASKIPDLLQGNIPHGEVQRIYTQKSSSKNILRQLEEREDALFRPRRVNYLEGESKVSTIHTFGFGSRHSDALLTTISKTGSGSYYFIEDGSVIADSFLDCLGGLLSIMCKDITLMMTPINPLVKIRRVRTHYEETVHPKTGKYEFDIPFLKAKEKRDMMIQLEFENKSEEGPIEYPEIGSPLISCDFSYTNRKEEEVKKSIVCVYLVRSEEEKKQPDYKKKMVRIEEFEIRTAVWVVVGDVKNIYGPNGDFEKATEAYGMLIQQINSSISAKTDFCQLLVGILTDQVKWFESSLVYRNTGGSQRISVFYEYLIQQKDLKEYREKMMVVNNNMEHFQVFVDPSSRFGRGGFPRRISPSFPYSSSQQGGMVLNHQHHHGSRNSADHVEKKKVKIRVGNNTFEGKLFMCSCCGDGYFECDGTHLTHDCRGQSRRANYTQMPLTRFRFRICFQGKRKAGRLEHFNKWKGTAMVGARRSMTLFPKEGGENKFPELEEILKEVGLLEKDRKLEDILKEEEE